MFPGGHQRIDKLCSVGGGGGGGAGGREENVVH